MSKNSLKLVTYINQFNIFCLIFGIIVFYKNAKWTKGRNKSRQSWKAAVKTILEEQLINEDKTVQKSRSAITE